MSDIEQAKQRQEIIEQIEIAVAEVDGSCSRDAARAVYKVFQAQLLTQAEEIRRLREALETSGQALLEIKAARANGPNWFTKGVSGQQGHIEMWLRKGLTARQEALTPTPTTWGQKALDVVDAAVARENIDDCDCCWDFHDDRLCNSCLAKEKALDAAVETLSELQKERTS